MNKEMCCKVDVMNMDELLEKVKEAYQQGRADAIDECIEMLEHDCFISGTASKVLIHHLEQLKDIK